MFGLFLCPLSPQRKEKSSSYESGDDFHVLTTPKKLTLSYLLKLLNVMCQSGYSLSKSTRLFQSCCKPSLCLTKLHNFKLIFSYKKSLPHCSSPCYTSAVPRPPASPFLEGGKKKKKKSKRGTVIYEPSSSPVEQNLPSVTY